MIELKDKPTTKHDVAMAFARLLMLLGKNDFTSLRVALHTANATFERWMEQRPEKSRITPPEEG